MDIHKNARLTPLRREEMARSVIEGRLSKAGAARVYDVSAKIVARWVQRYRTEGRAGMADRSSRPRRMPRLTEAVITERIAVLRRQRLTGRSTGRGASASAQSQRPPSVRSAAPRRAGRLQEARKAVRAARRGWLRGGRHNGQTFPAALTEAIFWSQRSACRTIACNFAAGQRISFRQSSRSSLGS